VHRTIWSTWPNTGRWIHNSELRELIYQCQYIDVLTENNSKYQWMARGRALDTFTWTFLEVDQKYERFIWILANGGLEPLSNGKGVISSSYNTKKGIPKWKRCRPNQIYNAKKWHHDITRNTFSCLTMGSVIKSFLVRCLPTPQKPSLRLMVFMF